MRRGRVVVGILLLGLLVPALLLTGLRLLGPAQADLVRLTAFVPLAVPLYAAGLLVGVPRWLRRRGEDGRRGPGPLVPVVLALAGLGVHGWWLAPHWTGGDRAAAEPRWTLEVLSTNLLKGRGDTAAMLRAAAEHRVDLLVVQEMSPTALRDLERLGLAEAYPHRVGTPADDPSGTMVFSTYPLRDVTALETEFQSWAMTVRTPDGPLRLLAVHPQPPVGDARTWAEELETIRAAVAGPPAPDLVVGDFNAGHDHAPFRRILADGGLRDAAELANSGWQPTWPSDVPYEVWGIPLPSLVAIDHVLVGDRLAATRVDTLRLEGTDHRAVIAHLAPSAGEGG